uniref:Uncharacterized protein n=1 Tax=Scophthalmus maximus TaxID=52904 RepID=A0A8D3CXI3_SCOMX
MIICLHNRTCPTLVLPQGIIEFVEDGLKQCDVITSLDIDAMMSTLFARLDKLGEFEMSLGVNNTGYWILFTLNQYYFFFIPYEKCKKRRCSNNYMVPNPLNLFDGYSWNIRTALSRAGREQEPQVENCLTGIRMGTEMTLIMGSPCGPDSPVS